MTVLQFPRLLVRFSEVHVGSYASLGGTANATIKVPPAEIQELSDSHFTPWVGHVTAVFFLSFFTLSLQIP